MRLPFFARRATAGPALGAYSLAQRPARKGASWLFLLPFFLIALLMGAVAGLGAPILLIILGGAVFATMLLFMLNAQLMLVALFVVTFLIQGTAMYFLGVRQATWVAVGMAMLMFFRVAIDKTIEGVRRDQVRPVGHAPVMVAVIVFALVYGFSLFLNRPGLGQMVASIKSVWPMFGVLLAFFWLHWPQRQIDLLWRVLLAVMFLQLPVVFYQHFVISGNHYGAFDSVVGTFGGTPLGGGLSSIMVLFVIATMMYALARWNRGLMSRRTMLVICGAALVIIIMGEVKASFIWLPVAGFIVLRKRVLKNVVSLFLYGCAAMVLVSGIYLAYKALYWGNGIDRARTVAEKLEVGGGYFFDTHNIDYRTGEVSRFASLALWAGDAQATIPRRLIGYGPGASKSSSTLGGGSLALRFEPLHIDQTALAVLLWDEGIVGTLAFAAIVVLGLQRGWRFVRAGQGSAAQLAAIETAVAMMVLYCSMLVYNRTLMDEPTTQLLFMFLLGCIVQAERFGPQGQAGGPTPPSLRQVPVER